MSSGYCSLDEDLEDCFFTAKTSFFRSAQSKVPAKVTRGWGMPALPHVRLRVMPKMSRGSAAGHEGFCPLLCGVCTAAGFSQPSPRRLFPLPGDPRLSVCFFSFR